MSNYNTRGRRLPLSEARYEAPEPWKEADRKQFLPFLKTPSGTTLLLTLHDLARRHRAAALRRLGGREGQRRHPSHPGRTERRRARGDPVKKSKEEAPKPGSPKSEIRDKRDAVRDKARGKRAVLRGAAAAATCLMMVGLLDCATATPSSKAQTSKACGNTITVNLNLWPGTNAVACAASAAGLTGTTTNVEKAAATTTGAACADGSCALPAAK